MGVDVYLFFTFFRFLQGELIDHYFYSIFGYKKFFMRRKNAKISIIRCLCAYSRNEQSFRQYVGTGINQVASAFLVVPAFRSFWLYGHSSFLAIPAVRSFWLFFVQENETFKVTKTTDRQEFRLIPSDCHLPIPPYFSSLITCKITFFN